jgi:hypothetical protein
MKKVTSANDFIQMEELSPPRQPQQNPEATNQSKRKKKNRNKNKKKEQVSSPQPEVRFEEDRPPTPLKDKLGRSFYEDTDSSEDEGLPDYKIGGYHPMHVGEVLVGRYLVI